MCNEIQPHSLSFSLSLSLSLSRSHFQKAKIRLSRISRQVRELLTIRAPAHYSLDGLSTAPFSSNSSRNPRPSQCQFRTFGTCKSERRLDNSKPRASITVRLVEVDAPFIKMVL
jgi:hypothetical protein